MTLQSVKNYRKSVNLQASKINFISQPSAIKIVNINKLTGEKIKPLTITALSNEIRLIRPGNSAKQEKHSFSLL